MYHFLGDFFSQKSPFLEGDVHVVDGGSDTDEEELGHVLYSKHSTVSSVNMQK